MIHGPRTLAAVAACAALALAAGCAGVPARPGSALGAEPSVAPRALALDAGGAPDARGAALAAAPVGSGAPERAGAALAESAPYVGSSERARTARIPSSPPAAGGGGRERGAARAGRVERDAEMPRGEAVSGVRARVLAAARRMLGTSPRLDCSGFVVAALAEAGVPLDLPPARSRSESLYLASRLVTRPSPGDLVFFHRTHDRDRTGPRAQRNRFTHVALVESVDGTALTLLHRGGKRVERIRMDLSRPSDPVANDPVRLRRKRDRAGTRYLSGELFAAFGGLLPDDVTRKLQARRGRDTSLRHPATR